MPEHDPQYPGPWYLYRRDEDGQESDQIFYDFDAATEQFKELEDRGFFERLTLTTEPTPLGEVDEDEDDDSAGAGCGCIIFIIIGAAVLIAVSNGWTF